MEEISQAQVDRALVECLRIFARRGRQLREQRERALEPDGGTSDSQLLLVPAGVSQTTPTGKVDTLFQTPNG